VRALVLELAYILFLLASVRLVGTGYRTLRSLAAPTLPYDAILLVSAGFGILAYWYPKLGRAQVAGAIVALLYVLYFWITKRLWPRFKRKARAASELTEVDRARLRRQMQEARA
jgi:O-antigen/teichoic acid export membrane protein